MYWLCGLVKRTFKSWLHWNEAAKSFLDNSAAVFFKQNMTHVSVFVGTKSICLFIHILQYLFVHFTRYSNLCLYMQGLGRHSVALNGEKIGTLVKIAFKPHGWGSRAITNQEEQNYPAHSWTDLFIRHPGAIVQCHLIHALFSGM